MPPHANTLDCTYADWEHKAGYWRISINIMTGTIPLVVFPTEQLVLLVCPRDFLGSMPPDTDVTPAIKSQGFSESLSHHWWASQKSLSCKKQETRNIYIILKRLWERGNWTDVLTVHGYALFQLKCFLTWTFMHFVISFS